MQGIETAEIVGLAHDGRGIARLGGKAVFVAGALPGEQVRIRRVKQRKRLDEAVLVELVTRSPSRVTPRCPHFGRCGGCALQHLDPEAQIVAKARELHQQLERIGHVRAASELPVLAGPLFGYRRRARLGVRLLAKSGRAIVGFRERTTPLLTDVRDCAVLAAPVGPLCEALGEMIGLLSIGDRIPQIEVGIGENATVLVLRVMAPPSEADTARLQDFSRQHAVQFWLQSAGPESAVPLAGAVTTLDYTLPEFDVRIEFGPLDFVQINAELNRRMVAEAIRLLAPEPGDRVLDLFCGLGNFTLPLARRAAQVLGVEGDAGLVARARHNAAINGIDNARFAVANLFAPLAGEPWARERYHRVLLDPPRAGAAEVLPMIAAGGATRLVYISCHPASFARDAGLLVNEHGFKLSAAGVMDMFPHTAHVESIAVFERRK
ncbi:MAG: 23S rRNA (uracil(1939)-C(5))-methyltransferase RlmD [Proteobacteria bacterium]|nr:23S rRNA (uracil(1939)-C(5))-methyltransferase RlmD [Pseudomonadota bacterium]